MIICDSHVHTQFSYDSQADMQQVILAAKQNNVSILTFTEHMDIDPPIELATNPSLGFSLLDVNAYFHRFKQLQKQYEEANFKLLWGIEIGLQPHLKLKHQNLINNYDWDFIIGSSHTIDHRDPYFPSFFKDLSSKNAILKYFQSILDNLEVLDDVDSYGHIDYVVRYLPEIYALPAHQKGPKLKEIYHPKDYQELLYTILDTLINKDIALEVNTQSLRRGFCTTNPHIDILKMYMERKGQFITIGSDAHSPNEVGAHISETLVQLKDLGFSHYCYFTKRVPNFLPLL